MNCPHCHSPRVKKNGHTFYGKQNHQCTACQRQFVESGPDWYVSQEDKILINKLLLERISLAGICRVCGVSGTWHLKYLDELYDNLPDDLQAETCLPDVDAYLADRMDEEIVRLGRLKKNDGLPAVRSRDGRAGVRAGVRAGRGTASVDGH